MVVGQPSNYVAIIQARMQSTRLPGKILKPMPISSNTSILECIVQQLKKSTYKLDIFIATSQNFENQILGIIAKTLGVNFYSGSEEDVWSRFYAILSSNTYPTVVRITADNPIIDHKILDETITSHLLTKVDYTTTQGLPLGMNFEIFQSEAFQKMATMDLTAQDREHVTPMFRQHHSFKTHTYSLQSQVKDTVRLTIDYPEDYLVVSTILEIAHSYQLEIGLDLIQFIQREFPWILEINKEKKQKKIYKNLEDELRDVIPMLQELEFYHTIKQLTASK